MDGTDPVSYVRHEGAVTYGITVTTEVDPEMDNAARGCDSGEDQSGFLNEATLQGGQSGNKGTLVVTACADVTGYDPDPDPTETETTDPDDDAGAIRIDSGVPPTPPIVPIATGVGLLAAAAAIALRRSRTSDARR